MSTLEAKILRDYRSIAIVGVSSNPEQASYQVASYLTEHGYRVNFVNPKIKEIMGKSSYPSLISIPEKVEVVDIFRRAEEVMPIVDEAIRIGAKAVWMQEGIINEAAASRARNAGLLVVMDRCMRQEHEKLSKRR